MTATAYSASSDLAHADASRFFVDGANNFRHLRTIKSDTNAEVTDPEQAYYWSREWQDAEAESRADYAAGRFRTFTDAEDAIAWLDSDDLA